MCTVSTTRDETQYARFALVSFFFFNDTATTEIYTLSLHDALPISAGNLSVPLPLCLRTPRGEPQKKDRKSTRLNSSHPTISYAVFCLKKNNTQEDTAHPRVWYARHVLLWSRVVW